VELDDGIKVCPLCGRNPENTREQENVPLNSPSQIIQLHREEKMKHLWELSGIIAFSGIAVCTVVDLIMNKKPGWSLYSDVSLLAVWIMLTLFIRIHKQCWVIGSCLMFTVLAMLFAFDLIAKDIQWFPSVGLPITFAAFAAAGVVVIIYRKARFKGFNLIAATFTVLSGFCVIAEITLDKYLYGFVDLRWSLITAAAILPVVLVFIFYHYRLKKGKRLDSFFHI